MSSCDCMLLSVLQLPDVDLSLWPDQTCPPLRVHLQQPINKVITKVNPNIAASFHPPLGADLLPAAQPFSSEAASVLQGQCQCVVAELSSAACGGGAIVAEKSVTVLRKVRQCVDQDQTEGTYRQEETRDQHYSTCSISTLVSMDTHLAQAVFGKLGLSRSAIL